MSRAKPPMAAVTTCLPNHRLWKRSRCYIKSFRYIWNSSCSGPFISRFCKDVTLWCLPCVSRTSSNRMLLRNCLCVRLCPKVVATKRMCTKAMKVAWWSCAHHGKTGTNRPLRQRIWVEQEIGFCNGHVPVLLLQYHEYPAMGITYPHLTRRGPVLRRDTRCIKNLLLGRLDNRFCIMLQISISKREIENFEDVSRCVPRSWTCILFENI